LHVTLPAAETATAANSFRADGGASARGTFLGIDGLEARARALAGRFTLAPPSRKDGHQFFQRLADNSRALRAAYHTLAEDVRRGEPIAPAAEWFLDNFHLLEAEIVGILHHLPRRYYVELPKLAARERTGVTRIQAIALDLIEHSDGRLELDRLTRFITAYQTVAPLTIGELWAWPTMLKAALIDSIRRLIDDTLADRRARIAAAVLFRDAEARAAERKSVPRVAWAGPSALAYVVELLSRLRDQGPEAAELRAQVDEWLAVMGTTAEEAVHAQHTADATAHVSMGNAITSLRFSAALDWSQFFERVSLVEQVLQRDPAGVYGRMDFQSRDRYRQALEELSGKTAEDQIKVAMRTVESARQSLEEAPAESLKSHVGYHLIGRGRRDLEADVAYRPPLSRRIRRFIFANATAVYLGMIALLTGLGAAPAAMAVLGTGWGPWVFLLALIPASELATGIVQWVVARLAPPRLLPRLELRDGVPEEGRTMVIVPTLLTNVEGVESLLDHLAVLALGNLDPHVHFAILSDFADAASETMPEDAALLRAAKSGIERLNARHGDGQSDRFFLFHRARHWNAREECWMGWERKRGKIEEFNGLLRGAGGTSYRVQVGDMSVLPQIRFCITLDSDTLLPRDAARKLIGIALHPLHRPRADSTSGRVVEGYGILQPRVSIAFSSAGGSRFSRLFAGHTAADPYTTAVSDTYQDLFGEGIFTGKGLYDVDAFMAALDDRVPENALLSHDLFEGLHARAALVSDVVVVDDYPGSVLAHSRRQHRWVRGDWQILLWALPWVPTRVGIQRNRLPIIGRWKILDNLRRSLVPPGMLLFLTWAWLALPGHPLAWTLAGLAAMSLPLLRELLRFLQGPAPQQTIAVYLRRAGEDLWMAAGQVLLSVAFLPYHAYLMLDAIVVTLIRLAFTRRRLLEWETAAAVGVRLAGVGGAVELRRFLAEMASSPAIALTIGAAILATRPAALPAAAPLLLIWILAPALGCVLSRPLRAPVHELDDDERALLARVARESWGYFAELAGAGDHWLPPDNMQEEPVEDIAHRTSPTNIGLAMLSTLAACDLGFLDLEELVDRLGKMFDSVESLERHEGHLLNWYDTETLAPLAPRYVSTVDSGNLAGCLLVLNQGLMEHAARGGALGERFEQLAARAEALFQAMDFRFLYDRRRRLFTVGYRLPDAEGPGEQDPAYYDLLASEARLASFIAIAKGDIPQVHWFSLSRQLVGAGGIPTLVSWSASMFEYLMPLLVMRSYPGTILDQSCRSAVRRQIEYARRQGAPWGISEAAYYSVDRHGHYQYKAFGVPGLGLKRGLTDELVIAPYATALAALVAPEEAVKNLRRLLRIGLGGRFGLYESIDYTPPRRYGLPVEMDGDLMKGDGATPGHEDGSLLHRGLARARREAGKPEGAIVRAFFAHHQGMIIVAFANILRNQVMTSRFHADPRVRATELLLEERVARHAPLTEPRPAEATRVAPPAMAAAPRVFRSPHTLVPRAHLISNGVYSTIITNAGSGASFWRGLAVTRWREDVTRDLGSQFIYLRDVRSGHLWSAAYHPVGGEVSEYRATYLTEKALFQRREDDIESQLEIAISPDEDVEVRRLSLTNRGDRLREIEVTSYVELALAPTGEDLAHPAFGKLFLATEALPEQGAILCGRRPRAAADGETWAMHVLSTEGRLTGPVEWETDRARFLGRGRGPEDALAVDGRPLSGTTGAVLDAVASLRVRVRLAPGAFVRLAFSTGVAASRAGAVVLAERYRDATAAARAFALAFTHAQIELQHLGIGTREAQTYLALASRLIYPDPLFRASPEVLARAAGGQPALWRHGISGDLPILLLRVVEEDDLSLVREVLKAQEYWRMKGLNADLVIVNEHPTTYRDEMQDALVALLDRGPWQAWRDRRGGVFLLRADVMQEGDRLLLAACARVVLSGDQGELANQLERPTAEARWPVRADRPRGARREAAAGADRARADRPTLAAAEAPVALPVPALSMPNGLGGFTDQGREYVVVLEGDRETPLPWAHVLANPNFGTVVTASGSAFSWAENSRENRLTPFANDAVSDPTSEAIFLRDEATGAVWGATPGPLRRDPGGGSYIVRFRAGSARFQHAAHGIAHDLLTVVHPEAPIKLSLLTLENRSGRKRRIGVFAYCEWALGPPRAGEHLHVVTERDAESGALTARNPYNQAYPDRVAFVAASEPICCATGDRLEFLGRNGSLLRPAAVGREALSGRFGAGLDPCAAMHLVFDLSPGEKREVVLALGQGADLAAVRELVTAHRHVAAAKSAAARVAAYWEELLGRLVVRTPDDSFDTFLNHWAPYQAIASRLLARCGYYQPGGAYGFRDQIQDVMGVSILEPRLEREHLLRAAGRQFVEGDVQHWWLPGTGLGVRTRCSDDLLWLPYAVAHYVETTGDTAILEERIPYLSALPLAPGELESYGMPAVSEEIGTLYQHCLRAIDKGLTTGQHGLPLIGTGDWNDGMNRVGHEGRGESVWLGWFLSAVLREFAPLCESMGDSARAATYRRELTRLADMLELSWDGDWYRRGYYDDGSTLGSAQDEECKIDSIAQSWALLSGNGTPRKRAERAMDAVRTHLIRRGPRVVLLLTPPFDKTPRDPGYIKGYVPGIRENGGQYSHAAIWTAMAMTRLGSGDEAVELFHMLNPINRTRSIADVEQYRSEPYVIAADVYAHPMHLGRGGWTWYTGSAAWMMRLGLESILGLVRHGDTFALEPCIPSMWPSFAITWRCGRSIYEIEVSNPDRRSTGIAAVTLDGVEVDPLAIPLLDDGRTHRVQARVGTRDAAAPAGARDPVAASPGGTPRRGSKGLAASWDSSVVRTGGRRKKPIED
jgi:cyclic beta-1,2-glucan synthetase